MNYAALDAIVARKDRIWKLAGDENTLMPAAGTAIQPASGTCWLIGLRAA